MSRLAEDHRLTPYSKGFVLAKKDLGDIRHFDKVSLPSGWIFWFDNATENEIAYSSKTFLIIRGHWADVSSASTNNSLAQRLLRELQNDENNFHESLALLAGRYVIIAHANNCLWVYTDASALRSVYYTVEAEPLVTSHLNLLIELTRFPVTYEPDSTLLAMDYTAYANVRQLLPNFRLNATTSSVERFFPTDTNRYESWSREEKLFKVEALWGQVLSMYAQRFNKLAISLTGGLDSKLVLAMANEIAPLLTAFTYGIQNDRQSKWSATMNMDFKNVAKILPHVELGAHTFIDLADRKSVPPRLRETLERNSWRKHGNYLIPLYRKLFQDADWLHLRGNGVEVVRRFWPHKNGDKESFLRQFTDANGPPLEQRAEQLGYFDLPSSYNAMDFGYWEIRMGKWHTELVNEQDAAFETLLPISVRAIYDILLAFPEEERKAARPITDLINRNNPILNFWVPNDSRNLYEAFRDRERESSKWLPTLSETKPDRRPLRNRQKGESDTLTVNLTIEDFENGTAKTLTIFRTKVSGSLTCTIEQPYFNLNAEKHFEWKLLIDGVAVLRCDGAITRSPTTVTAANLERDSEVSIRLEPLRKVSTSSWEKATRLTVSNIRFHHLLQEGDGQVRIGSSNPYAVLIPQTK